MLMWALSAPQHWFLHCSGLVNMTTCFPVFRIRVLKSGSGSDFFPESRSVPVSKRKTPKNFGSTSYFFIKHISELGARSWIRVLGF